MTDVESLPGKWGVLATQLVGLGDPTREKEIWRIRSLINELESALAARSPTAKAVLAPTEDRRAPSAGVGVDARDALRKAFRFGETYCQQADSEYTSHHRKADETMAAFKAWADEAAAALQHPAAPSVDGGEIARLQGVIERDRTVFCGLIVRCKNVLKGRKHLGDENARAASGYAYDEPGFIREFGEAWTEIMGELERMHRVFQDFTDSPRGDAIRPAQAEAEGILSAAPSVSPAVAGDHQYRVPAELEAWTARIIRRLEARDTNDTDCLDAANLIRRLASSAPQGDDGLEPLRRLLQEFVDKLPPAPAADPAEQFCDGHCSALEHHPDCVRAAEQPEVDLCEVARELERVHVAHVIGQVEAIAEDRTDAYWSGYSMACDEIAHRLNLAPAKPAEQPQGEMVLVPREPTDEMLDAAMAAVKANTVILDAGPAKGATLVRDPHYHVYRAMLSAAPSRPVVGEALISLNAIREALQPLTDGRSTHNVHTRQVARDILQRIAALGQQGDGNGK